MKTSEPIYVRWCQVEKLWKVIGRYSGLCYVSFQKLENLKSWLDRQESVETVPQKVHRRLRRLFS